MLIKVIQDCLEEVLSKMQLELVRRDNTTVGLLI